MAVITYKCPNCGGDLQFNPEHQNFHCQYCLSDFAEDALEKDEPEEEALQDDPELDDSDAVDNEYQAVLYHCPSCGAEIVTDETTAATFCYYCHNPVVLSGRLQGQYNPDYVVPFAIDREKALTIFSQWIGRKKYVPKVFYNQNQIEKMSGIYFPYWLYNCHVDGRLAAQATKRQIRRSGSIEYTKTDQFDVIREGEMPVKHVTRNALKKSNRQLVEGVLPFEMEKLKAFRMSYLSGFQAEKRDMEKTEFSSEVETEVRQFAEQSLRSQISGYDSVNVRSCSADIRNPEWQYALMPVWTLTYRDNNENKLYYFACNGQTGRICGELPVDNGRLAVLFAQVAVPLFVILMIVGYFL
ncbi:MAG: TFIIB-type zinc ribbon-containing protein [Lachnospiraceae bacterium]